MKIILSRKGIDGGNGGLPSPLLIDSGRRIPISIPIGGGSEKWRYDQVTLHGHNLKKIATSLGVRGRKGKSLTAESALHFDPDLDAASAQRKPGWKGMFGQCKAALGHLEKQQVGDGDLFLFFGWFKEATFDRDQYRFLTDSPNLQAFFGWLQVRHCWEMDHLTDELQRKHPRWAWEHPHFQDKTTGYGKIYVAADELMVGGKRLGLPGAGLFSRCTQAAHLTWPGAERRTIWSLPQFFHSRNQPRLSYHRREERWERRADRWKVQSVSRGQEFVLDLEKLEVSERKYAHAWAVELIREHI